MKKVHFDKKRCKGCGMCILFCPQKTLRMSADLSDLGFTYPELADEEHCTVCGICFRMCPDCAIQIEKDDTKKPKKE